WSFAARLACSCPPRTPDLPYADIMTDKNQTPDRAGSYDADGLDVPTYHKDTHAAGPAPRASGAGSTPLSGQDTGADATSATTQFPQSSGGLFSRPGRAAPQEIKP